MALRIKLYGEIDPGTAFLLGPSGEETACSAEAVQDMLNENPDEKDVYIDIHSPGGSMHEGFAIYDVLRTSGRNIHTNIVGACHSMAVTVLLAAPLKWRSANPNIRSLIHRARTYPGDYCTEEELRQLADDTRREEDEMIKIYVQRTKLTERKARELIAAEKVHTAQDLLEMGFISTINQYTSNKLNINQKSKAMAQKPAKQKPAQKPATQKNEGASLLDRIGTFFTNAAKVLSPVNFDYEDEEGNLLFSTASESDDLEVGTEVTFPDDTTGGTFTLPDGRIVTIEDLIVTDIQTESEETANLRTENEQLREQLAEAVNLIEEMKGQIGSNYQPQNRTTVKATTATRTVRKNTTSATSKEDIKNEIKENHSKGFAFRGIHARK